MLLSAARARKRAAVDGRCRDQHPLVTLTCLCPVSHLSLLLLCCEFVTIPTRPRLAQVLKRTSRLGKNLTKKEEKKQREKKKKKKRKRKKIKKNKN